MNQAAKGALSTGTAEPGLAKTAIRRSVQAVALIGLSAACFASAASADTTTTQTVAPGGIVSSGPAPTPADPVQVFVQTPKGGTITITKISNPKAFANTNPESTSGPNFFEPTPEIDITPPASRGGDGYLPVVFVIDGSSVPRPGPGFTTAGEAKALGRLMKVFQNYDGKAPTNDTGSQLYPNYSRLPNGDIKAVTAIGSYLHNYDGSPASRVSLYPSYDPFASTTTIRPAPSSPQNGYAESLDESIDHGIVIDNGCNWFCVGSVTLTISRTAAKKLGLKSTTLLKLTGLTRATTLVHFPLKVRKGLRKFNRISITPTVLMKPQTGFGFKSGTTVFPRPLVLQADDN
jgi:hypothetical protein